MINEHTLNAIGALCSSRDRMDLLSDEAKLSLYRALADEVPGLVSEVRRLHSELAVKVAQQPVKLAGHKCVECGHDDVNLGWCKPNERLMFERLHCLDCCYDPNQWVEAS